MMNASMKMAAAKPTPIMARARSLPIAKAAEDRDHDDAPPP